MLRLKIMFLKNYTSNVPVCDTVYRIEKVLIRCGAASIAKEYGSTEGDIKAVAFQIETPSGKMPIRLPVDVDRALDALWMDYVGDDKVSPDGKSVAYPSSNRKKKRRGDFIEQAQRTAWKIVQDWVEVQMSMIQLKQADTLEVFMAYVITDTGETMYRRALAGNGFKQLAAPQSK